MFGPWIELVGWVQLGLLLKLWLALVVRVESDIGWDQC